MRRTIVVALFLLSLVACAPAPEVNIQATADALAATGVAETLAAMPSDTSVPSATSTATAPPPTATEATTAESTSTSTTQVSAAGTQANVGPTVVSATELANKKDNSTAVKLTNNTDEIIWLIIEGDGYWEYRFSDSFVILLPLGEYHYRAWIGDSGPYEGNFRIGNPDKHTFIFSPGKVVYQGP